MSTFLRVAGRHCLRQPRCVNGVARRHFSLSAAQSKIVKVLENEIQHEKEQYSQSKEIKKFVENGPFKLEEQDGDVNMTLVREVGEKLVRIEWQLSSPFDPSIDGEGGGEIEGTPDSTGFSFTIENKKTGAGLTFFCTTQAAEDHRFVVGSVARFASKEQKESVSSYTGPEFEDLDEKLQEALDEYLAEMGMTDDVCNFIDATSLDKEQREYMSWLNGLKAIIEE